MSELPNHPEVPTKSHPSKVIYDFVTDVQLVPKMVGYREGKGFTVEVVNIQPDVEANWVTDLPAGSFPVKTKLAIPPGTQAWAIISRLGAP